MESTVLPGRFAPLDDLTPEEVQDERTRVVSGSGTSFLEVPGLVTLSGLRIGVHELPLEETRRYPTDALATVHEEVQEPLVVLQQRGDGTAVLVRSVLSNDGIWPKGASIYVTGDWDGSVQGEATVDVEGEQPGTGASPAQLAAVEDKAIGEKSQRSGGRRRGA